ncbi:MAG: hypothetical protein JW999_00480, partial [Methanotrichaceae archaeon]|nr:hypothetical protein [Methanotrichaceae archaeon]
MSGKQAQFGLPSLQQEKRHLQTLPNNIAFNSIALKLYSNILPLVLPGIHLLRLFSQTHEYQLHQP